MEAAGLMNTFSCIVIRGICDYADSYKNDAWQNYAALRAAAYAKDFLQYVRPAQTTEQKSIQDIVGIMTDQLQVSRKALDVHMSADTRYQEEQHRFCHQAFKTCSYEQYKEVNPDRAEGTCRWVLSHRQYKMWSASNRDSLLWISADPGCGKSVLAKSLVDKELQQTAEHSICYFFFKDNEEQDKLSTALCAILHQLFAQQPQLLQHAMSTWRKSGNKMQQDVQELWRILVAAAGDEKVQHVTCVLDALDECRLSDRHPDRHQLIKMLGGFHTNAQSSVLGVGHGRLKFLVTSRPYHDIELEFQRILQDFPTIRLRGENENDQIHQEIDTVIRIRINELAEYLQLGYQLRDRLLTKLLEMEHRTYLWLHLAVDSIYTTYQTSFRPEDEVLDLLPSTVEDAYEKILGRVNNKQRGKVQRILRIVVGSRRALTVAEMAIALGIAVGKPSAEETLDRVRLDPERLRLNIRQWCGLFVFISHDRIYLIHQTAKEFLLADTQPANSLSGWKHCLDPGITEEEMTRICVDLLGLKTVWRTVQNLASGFDKLGKSFANDLEDPLERFLTYAAVHLPSHVTMMQRNVEDEYVDKLCCLYEHTAEHAPWFDIYRRGEIPPLDQPSISGLHLAAYLGHDRMVYRMLQHPRTLEMDRLDSHGYTALMWAAERCHRPSVQILLDHHANVNVQGDRRGDALQAALVGGSETIVRLLLDAGADINKRSGREDKSALYVACERASPKLVELLLAWGADVNALGGYHGNALQAVSFWGKETMVQMLLDHGADVNTQGGVYYSALQAASIGSTETVMQMLLDHGADVNAQGGKYGSALQAASYIGAETVVQMLVNHGADVNMQGGKFGNVLQAATIGGIKTVIQILLDHGADINAEGGTFRNALEAAYYCNKKEVMQMLLDAGAIDTRSESNK